MRLLAFVVGLSLSVVAAAQTQKTRPATEADFTGYWRIVLIPNEVHRSRFKNEEMGYADPCQFLVHKPDGTWFNISVTNMAGPEESRRQCPTTRAGVDTAMFAQTQSPFRWSKLPNQNGLFFIRDTRPQTDPQKPVALLWKADYVLEDVPGNAAFAFDLKKGDVLMQMTQRMGGNNIAPVWPMLLRPVGD
jgi:hypothetical protein